MIVLRDELSANQFRRPWHVRGHRGLQIPQPADRTLEDVDAVTDRAKAEQGILHEYAGIECETRLEARVYVMHAGVEGIEIDSPHDSLELWILQSERDDLGEIGNRRRAQRSVQDTIAIALLDAHR